jgi:hypothetical protein
VGRLIRSQVRQVTGRGGTEVINVVQAPSRSRAPQVPVWHRRSRPIEVARQKLWSLSSESWSKRRDATWCLEGGTDVAVALWWSKPRPSLAKAIQWNGLLERRDFAEPDRRSRQSAREIREVLRPRNPSGLLNAAPEGLWRRRVHSLDDGRRKKRHRRRASVDEYVLAGSRGWPNASKLRCLGPVDDSLDERRSDR